MYLGEQTCKIRIADKYVLTGLHHLQIKRSVHQAIQTAIVELPLSAVIRNNELLEDIKLSDKIKEGDSISIAFGYDGNNNKEFEGYIKRTNKAMPFVLECEDDFYLMRKIRLKKSFGKCTLKDIMQYLVAEVNKIKTVQWKLYDKMAEFNFSNYMMNGVNGIDVLNDLRNTYKLNTYLTRINGESIVYSGLRYGLQREDIKYVINTNTIGADELKYITPDKDTRFKITIKNFNRNGTTTTIETGDKDGQQEEFYYHGENSLAALKMMAAAELQMKQTAGFSGGFDTFIFPFAQPGDIANISDEQFEERKARHYIGTVTTQFGVSGGKRKIEIDFKLS